MKYQDFLFSQLFMNHIEEYNTEYKDLEYDLIFPIVLMHQGLFLKSNFNVDINSEYDCIINYLINSVK